MSTSDESKEKQTALGRLAASLERILKIGAAFVALAYVFGLIVLNVHFGRYGYHSLGLLQVDYVAVGLWALSPVALACLLVFVVFYSFAQDYLFQDTDNIQPKTWADKIATFIGGIVIWLFLGGLFFYCLDITFRWLWFVALGLGFFISVGFGLLPAIIGEVKEKRERILSVAMFIWVVVLLPFYLIFFGRYIYETIPDKWAGGQMASVVLVTKDDAARSLLETSGVQFTDAKKSVPVKLILATEKELLLLPSQHSRGLKLSRDLVVAIIYSQ